VLERIREARRDESGFTLIELLIVIVILGVLAGIVVFAVSNFNDDGKTAACKSDYKNVEIAQEAYFAKKTPTHAYAGDVATLVNANYLKDTPDGGGHAITTDNTGAVKVDGLAGNGKCG
jgi:prepilin-type N-terminal cleavage/methylation domain-containing protein